MELKFLLTLVISISFLILYWLKQRQEKAFLKAEQLPAEVLNCYYFATSPLTPDKTPLNKEHQTNSFDVDRNEALGNYIQLRYYRNNQEYISEYAFIDRAYAIGEVVIIEYINEKTFRLQGEDRNRLPLAFLGLAMTFLLISLAGFFV